MSFFGANRERYQKLNGFRHSFTQISIDGIGKGSAPKKKAEPKKKETPKKAEPKKEAPKKVEPKKKTTPKKAEPKKKAAPKKVEPKKKAAPKKAAPNKAPAKPAEPEPVAEVETAVPAADGPASRPMALDAARDGKADDLKRIKGIGKVLEGKLNGLGIWHFDQIAAWTDAEIAWVDSRLKFKGRIVRDNWIAQAAELAKKNT